MSFVTFCVGFVILIIILVVTGGIGGLASIDDDGWTFTGWVLSSLGFTVCLTMLLYQNGIIK